MRLNYYKHLNVFLIFAAIKEPRKETKTLPLILTIIENERIHLVGDEFLVEEMVRYVEEFRSETASWILSALLDKIKLTNIGKNLIKICKNYIETPNISNIIHAAVCLRTDAILITNDAHFNKIRDEGIIKVWNR